MTDSLHSPNSEHASQAAGLAPQTKAQILAEALPYIRRFHGKTIVIKYGGEAMLSEQLRHSFARDVTLLKLVGMNPVVVHGGRNQIEQALKKIGRQGSYIQGMQVADDELIEVVEWVLGGEVQQDIVMLINYYGGQAVGLTGKDGGLIRARKMQVMDRENPQHLIDLGFAGEIDAINPVVVQALQDDAFIPVISPIGIGEDGRAYALNADMIAAKLAQVLKAEKIILMTNAPGVVDGQDQLLPDLTLAEMEGLARQDLIAPRMLPRVQAVLDALRSGVPTGHVIDGRVEHSLLLEILTDQPFGTRITSR